MVQCRYVLLGDESAENLRLSQILRATYGTENVTRLLELAHLEPVLVRHSTDPIVICFDLLSYDPNEALPLLASVRETHPQAVFCLYVEKGEFRERLGAFPEHWRKRLRHYFKLYKQEAEIEFEPMVRASLRTAADQALHNTNHEPIRRTPVFEKGLVAPAGQSNDAAGSRPSFISYSRKDWPEFVAGLVSDLTARSHKVWVDQDFIAGGDDWLDAVGEALQICDTLVLVLSPEALSSRFVKMEYRFFFLHDKPIIPILYRPVSQLPVELSTLHYLDVSHGDRGSVGSEVSNLLARRKTRRSGPARE